MGKAAEVVVSGLFFASMRCRSGGDCLAIFFPITLDSAGTSWYMKTGLAQRAYSQSGKRHWARVGNAFNLRTWQVRS